MSSTNTYSALRRNASLVTVAGAAVRSAKRAEAKWLAFRGCLPTGVLLSFEQSSTNDRLFAEFSERDDLAKHLVRLASK